MFSKFSVAELPRYWALRLKFYLKFDLKILLKIWLAR